MKNFQNIQAKMGEAQEKLKELKETGTAGGDMVKVEINGHMEILKVKISPEIVDPRDPEMLEDLVKAAMADALFRIKEAIRIEMSSLTGGIKLPPGLGL
jgi:DNA-binding YbaB/EbfC family protein